MMMKDRMEEKRVEEELKHVCRLCSKRYPSGKSLGGHMRSHVIANSNASSSSSSLHKLMKPKKALLAFESNKNGVTVFGGDTNGYGLRENPRKTWRMVDTSAVVVTSNQGRRVCKQCGRSFQSLKALCGHMSSHSERDRNFTRFKDDDEDYEYEEEEEDDEDEDHSWASEEEDDGSKGRSARYRAVAVIGCSSNSSGVELELEQEQEQEQLAMCLMMLSRDSGQRVGFNFTAESSDNNSVILEGGSTSNFAAKRKHLKFSSEKPNNCANGSVKMSLSAARKKVNCPELDNSDSGYFENGAKELESDDSADGYSSGGGRNGCKKVKIGDVSPTKSPHKAGKYQCSVCQKSFKTHQALGGHIITHRRDIKNANCNGEYERSAKKTKGHCCPFCPKVFRSGQALGGHKRSHLIGCSSQDKASLIKLKRREHHHRLLDLNLPAPVEEDGNGASDGEHGQFKPW